MAFDKFKAPNFPAPPKQYEFPYFNQVIRSLNTFFAVGDAGTPTNSSVTTTTQLKMPYANVTLTNGISATNDNIKPIANTFLRIIGPNAAFDVRGINSEPQNQNDGRVLILVNRTGATVGAAPQNMTIHNEEAAVLMYSVKDLRWLVISHQ
jgi:hypothetical protein